MTTEYKFFDTQGQAEDYASQVMEYSDYSAFSYWCETNRMWVVQIFKGFIL